MKKKKIETPGCLVKQPVRVKYGNLIRKCCDIQYGTGMPQFVSLCVCLMTQDGHCLSLCPPTISYELVCTHRTKGSFRSSVHRAVGQQSSRGFVWRDFLNVIYLM